MSAKKNNHTLLKVTMAAAGIGAAVAYGKARAAEKKKGNTAIPADENRTTGENDIYFVGGGLGSLAGAAYLIRDAGRKADSYFGRDAHTRRQQRRFRHTRGRLCMQGRQDAE